MMKTRFALDRIQERAEQLRKVADDAERGTLPSNGLPDVKLGLWKHLQLTGDEPIDELNATLELARQSQRALLAIAVRAGCDPERLLDPREVNRGDSVVWAALGAKLKALATPVTAESANRANHFTLFPQGVPGDPDIVDLVVRLHSEHAKPASERRSNNEVAREFTRELRGSDVRARRLLARVRRMKRDGKVVI